MLFFDKIARTLDYIEKEKGVYLVWNGSDDDLFTTEKGIEKLPFMKFKQS